MLGVLLGPLLFAIIPFLKISELSHDAHVVLGLMAWMMAWWLSELLPLGVTALLPILVLPSSNILKLSEVTPIYGSDIIFLFLGGFLISIALEKWKLHQALAERILPFFSRSVSFLLLGFMLITAALSMWISNTACAFMMLPMALAVAKKFSKHSVDIEKALLFGVAYSASIGGVGTIIGSPPNAILIGYLENNDLWAPSFGRWFIMAAPLLIFGLLACWLVIRFFYLRKGISIGDLQKSIEFSRWSKNQKRVLIVFILTAMAWILRPLIPGNAITDTWIAVAAIVVLYLIPSAEKTGEALLALHDLSKVSWSILLLFGGGLTLAKAFQITGFDQWMAYQLTGLLDLGVWVLILIIVLVSIMFTEIGSNTAVAALIVPIVGSLSGALGQAQGIALIFAVTFGASLSFMMPMATPPNAIVFHSKRIHLTEMIKIGFWLNLIFWVLISLVAYFWIPIVI